MNAAPFAFSGLMQKLPTGFHRWPFPNAFSKDSQFEQVRKNPGRKVYDFLNRSDSNQMRPSPTHPCFLFGCLLTWLVLVSLVVVQDSAV